MISTNTIYAFGFALVGILLLFYVLCSKEGLVGSIWLKPISFLTPAADARRRKRARLSVTRWEETFYSPEVSSAEDGVMPAVYVSVAA